MMDPVQQLVVSQFAARATGQPLVQIALSIHEHVCDRWRLLPEDDRLAHPFNVPTGMPPHIWRMSADVVSALYKASPPPVGPNPKGSYEATLLLFGWPIVQDAEAPRGTLLLVQP